MIPFRGVSQASQQLGPRAIPQRQPSAGAPPVTQPFRTQNQAYPPQLQQLRTLKSSCQEHGELTLVPNAAPSAAQQAEQSLDPSDFPALGSATWSNAGAAGGGITSSQQQAQQNLLSSYASQAGTAVQPPPLSSSNQPPPGSNPSNQALPSPALPSAGQPPSAGLALASAAAAAAAQAAHNRDFTPDDFPALGGFGGQGELGLGGHPNGQVGPPQNGLSLMGGRSGSGHAAPGQEQASAVAALQHQHLQSQHRANLLGSMNGAGGPGSPAQQAAQQPRTVSGQQPFPSEPDKRVRPRPPSSVADRVLRRKFEPGSEGDEHAGADVCLALRTHAITATGLQLETRPTLASAVASLDTDRARLVPAPVAALLRQHERHKRRTTTGLGPLAAASTTATCGGRGQWRQLTRQRDALESGRVSTAASVDTRRRGGRADPAARAAGALQSRGQVRPPRPAAHYQDRRPRLEHARTRERPHDARPRPWSDRVSLSPASA